MSTGAHVEVGAYALDLLEPGDRQEFEGHLGGCPRCRHELAGLRGVAAMLAEVSAAELSAPPPGPATVTSLLERRARARRRDLRSRALAGAAAGVVLLAGALGLGATLDGPAPAPRAAPDGSAEQLLRTGRLTSATDARTGVSGRVAAEPKAWGTRVALSLSRVRGPLDCRLVAVDKAGRAHPVSGWSVPDRGYGIPGSPQALSLQGGTSLKPDEIDHYEIRTTPDDRRLLSLPA